MGDSIHGGWFREQGSAESEEAPIEIIDGEPAGWESAGWRYRTALRQFSLNLMANNDPDNTIR